MLRVEMFSDNRYFRFIHKYVWYFKYLFMKEKEVSVDLENRLKIYVPDLFKLIEGQNISWLSINRKFGKFLQQRKIRFHKGGGYLKDQVNFYDVVVQTINGKQEFERFFIYMNVVFRRLNENLSSSQKIMVSKIVRNLLREFSLDYIHSLGELYVLDSLVRHKMYRLVEVEFKLNNGKCIDFKLISSESNKDVLVEIMNIRLDEKKLNSHKEISEYLMGKFSSKIDYKTMSIPSNFNFFIVPVIWGSKEDLLKVNDFYKNGSGITINRMMEPFSYCCWVDETGKTEPFYKFSRISTLFDDVN